MATTNPIKIQFKQGDYSQSKFTPGSESYVGSQDKGTFYLGAIDAFQAHLLYNDGDTIMDLIPRMLDQEHGGTGTDMSDTPSYATIINGSQNSLTYVANDKGAYFNPGATDGTSNHANVLPRFGILPIDCGGTGSASFTANRVIYSSSTSALSSSNHYSTGTKMAINTTVEKDQNFYVTGNSGFNGNIVLDQPSGSSAHSIYRVGQSSSWWNGRANAMLRQISAIGYSPIISMKTTNGSWDIGHYNADSWHDILLFNFKADSTFNASNNTIIHALRLYKDGQLSIAGNLRYLNSSTATTTTNEIDVIKFITGNNTGCGMIIGGGDGLTMLGSGSPELQSADSLSATSDNTYVTSNIDINFYTNCDTIGNRVGVKLNFERAFYPILSSAGCAGSIGTSSFVWSNGFFNRLNIRGATHNGDLMNKDSNNPGIVFSSGYSGAQSVYLLYTDYNSYRSPAGLKIIGNSAASDASSPAWLELEGSLILHKDIVYRNGTNNEKSMIRFETGNNDGAGILIGGGGYAILGSGNSADNLNANASILATTKKTYIASDEDILFYTNCSTIGNKIGTGLSASGEFYPILSATGHGGTIGKPTRLWSNGYFNRLNIRGATNNIMDHTSENPGIEFSANFAGSQPVYLLYTHYDNYRDPAGLKIVGDSNTDSSTPAWLEVEGSLILNKNIVYANESHTEKPVVRFITGSDTGAGIIIGGGGPVIIGGGESANDFATALLGANLMTGDSEQTYITSDNNIYFYTNCNTIAERKGVILNTSKVFYPDADNTGHLGATGYNWIGVHTRQVLSNNDLVVNAASGKTVSVGNGATKFYTKTGNNGTQNILELKGTHQTGSGTNNEVQFGDGGPQILFTSQDDQTAALHFSGYNNVSGAGATLSLVSNQDSVLFSVQRIRVSTIQAKGDLGIFPGTGTNGPDNGIGKICAGISKSVSKSAAQFYRESACAGSWWQGRDMALIREVAASGYHPLLSFKTPSGSWEVGNYVGGVAEGITFCYNTDYGYGQKANTSGHYKESFGLVPGGFYTKNFGTSNPGDSTPGKGTVGAVYFKLIS